MKFIPLTFMHEDDTTSVVYYNSDMIEQISPTREGESGKSIINTIHDRCNHFIKESVQLIIDLIEEKPNV